MYNDDNKFNLYLAQIDDAFLRNPVAATEIIKKYFDSVDYSKEKNANLVKIDKYLPILVLIIFCLGILALGCFNISQFVVYVIGFVFFIAGVLVSILVPGIGLIFLFTHGFAGLGLMITALDVSKYKILLTDAPRHCVTIVVAIIVLLFIAAFFSVGMNSFGALKGKKYRFCYPFIFFFFFILAIIFIPQIIGFLTRVL